MKVSALIAALQTAQDDHGDDIEVKLDVEGCDCDPDIQWYERKQILYLW